MSLYIYLAFLYLISASSFRGGAAILDTEVSLRPLLEEFESFINKLDKQVSRRALKREILLRDDLAMARKLQVELLAANVQLNLPEEFARAIHELSSKLVALEDEAMRIAKERIASVNTDIISFINASTDTAAIEPSSMGVSASGEEPAQLAGSDFRAIQLIELARSAELIARGLPHELQRYALEDLRTTATILRSPSARDCHVLFKKYLSDSLRSVVTLISAIENERGPEPIIPIKAEEHLYRAEALGKDSVIFEIAQKWCGYGFSLRQVFGEEVASIAAQMIMRKIILFSDRMNSAMHLCETGHTEKSLKLVDEIEPFFIDIATIGDAVSKFSRFGQSTCQQLRHKIKAQSADLGLDFFKVGETPEVIISQLETGIKLTLEILDINVPEGALQNLLLCEELIDSLPNDFEAKAIYSKRVSIMRKTMPNWRAAQIAHSELESAVVQLDKERRHKRFHILQKSLAKRAEADPIDIVNGGVLLKRIISRQ